MLCLLLNERGITAQLKTPVYLLDALCGACMTPAYAQVTALMNTDTAPSVVEQLLYRTPPLSPENVLLSSLSGAPSSHHITALSKRRKVTLSNTASIVL